MAAREEWRKTGNRNGTNGTNHPWTDFFKWKKKAAADEKKAADEREQQRAAEEAEDTEDTESTEEESTEHTEETADTADTFVVSLQQTDAEIALVLLDGLGDRIETIAKEVSRLYAQRQKAKAA